MESRKVLYFIGEKLSERKLVIKGKPSFYDALLLSKNSPHSLMKSPYQSIPLSDITKVSYYIQESSTKVFQELTDDQLLNHFIVKDGSRTSYLIHLPNEKVRQTKGEKQKISAACKKMKV